MRKLSTSLVLKSATDSALRFPFVLLCSMIAAAIAVYLVDAPDSDSYLLINILMSAGLGIPLFFCLEVLIERNDRLLKYKWGVIALGFVFLFLVYWGFPEDSDSHDIYWPYMRYAAFIIVAHLAVAFAPYLNKNETNGFWNYNKALFIRILTAVLYSGVMYGGISLALISLDLLFDVEIRDETFGKLFLITALFFNTWVFISGIPTDFKALESDVSYPKGLRVFAQFILLPILGLYLVILYAYLGKVLFLWDWPSGMVVYLILAVAIVGIFALLLLFPYGQTEEKKWLDTVTRIYYFLLYPLVGMLFISLYMRLEEYGITINRYTVAMLGSWLLFIAVYMTFRRSNIKMIPLSLAVFIVLGLFGPLGAPAVSERSQVKRLKSMLVESGVMTADEKLNYSEADFDAREINTTSNDLVSDSAYNEMYGILRYLRRNHGYEGLNKLYAFDMNQKMIDRLEENQNLDVREEYLRSFGLSDYSEHHAALAEKEVYPEEFRWYTSPAEVKEIKGYDYYAVFDFSGRNNWGRKKELKGKDLVILMEWNAEAEDKNAFKVSINGNQTQVDLSEMVHRFRGAKKYAGEFEPEQLMLDFSDENLSYKIYFKEVVGSKLHGNYTVNRVKGEIFIKLRE